MNLNYFFPLIGVFRNPRENFKKIAAHPQTSFLFLFFILVNVAGLYLVPLVSPKAKAALDQLYPFVERFHLKFWLIPISVVLPIGLNLMWTGFLMMSVRLIGASARFLELWRVTLFIEIIGNIIALLLSPLPILPNLVWIFKLVYSIIAVIALYDFTTGRAIAAYALAFGVQMALSMVLMVGGGALFMRNSDLMKSMAPEPNLRPIKIPVNLNWSVQSLDGQVVPLSQMKNKILVLNFWATWCGPCRLEMPSLQKLHDLTKDKNVAVMAISDEDSKTLKTYLTKEHLTLPVYILKGIRVPPFETSVIPTTFIISPEGFIIGKHEGYTDWSAPAILEFLRKIQTPASFNPV